MQISSNISWHSSHPENMLPQNPQRAAVYPKSGSPVDLTGVHVRISCLEISPFMVHQVDGGYTGLTHSIFEEASKNFNYTFEYICANLSEGSGKGLGNGNWDGMLGAITTGKADIVATAAMTSDRLSGPFDFTSTYFTIYGTFVTAHAGTAIQFGTLAKPFLPMTWLALLLALILVFATSYFALSCDYGNRLSDSKDLIEEKKVSLYKSISLPYAYLVEQGGRKVPLRLRCLISFWLMFCIVIGTGYKERLFASITFPGSTKIPTTVTELAAMTNYRVLVNYWPTVLYTSWENSPQSDFKSVYNRFERTSDISSCVISAIGHQETVCIAYSFELQSAISSVNLSLRGDIQPPFMSSEAYFPSYQHFVLPKGSPQAGSWNWIASNVRDFGLPRKWMNDIFEKRRDEALLWFKKRKKKNETLSQYRHREMLNFREQPRAVKLMSLMGLLCTYGTLLIISAIIFLIEVFIRPYEYRPEVFVMETAIQCKQNIDVKKMAKKLRQDAEINTDLIYML